ncbi:MAG: hypothetical protein AB8H86_24560 [Polyangiales bacterium]
MRTWTFGLWCSVLLCGACADAVPALTFDIRALTTAGEDPFVDADSFDRVRIRVKQQDSQVITLEAATAGTFDLSTSFESLSAPTRVRLELEGDNPLHGAPPVFAPGASQGVVRFAVGAPSSCERVDGFDRDSDGASFTRIDTFILGAGGQDSSSVWIFDLLRLATTELDPLPSEGPTVSTRLGASSALIINDSGAYRYDLGVDPSQDDRVAELALHQGADHTTALLTRENGGVLAVGPGLGFSLIAPDGRVILGDDLATARTRPGLVEIGGSPFIFGGNADGALFEIVDVDRGETTPMGDGTLPSSAGALNVDGTVWLIHDDDTSSVIRGCPACEMPEAGPANSGVVVGATHLITAGMLSAVPLEEALPPGQAPTLDPVASPLTPPRAVFAYESGIVFLADDEGAQLCFPGDLSPL